MFLHLLFDNILFHLSGFILSSFAIISVFTFFHFLALTTRFETTLVLDKRSDGRKP